MAIDASGVGIDVEIGVHNWEGPSQHALPAYQTWTTCVLVYPAQAIFAGLHVVQKTCIGEALLVDPRVS